MIEFNRVYTTVQNLSVKFFEEHSDYIVGAYLLRHQWIGETWSKESGKAYTSKHDLVEINDFRLLEINCTKIKSICYFNKLILVHTEYQYIATSKNGNITLFKGSPIQTVEGWHYNDHDLDIAHASINIPNNWEHSVKEIKVGDYK